MTEQRINQLLREEISKALHLNLKVREIKPIVDFPKATSFYASCTIHSDGTASIRVSRYYMEGASERQMRETLAHEICHAVYGVTHGHGASWKACANAFNSIYGYNIQRLGGTSQGDFQLSSKVAKVRYVVKCESCGQEIKRTRNSRLTLHPEHYRCGICGGHLYIDETNYNA